MAEGARVLDLGCGAGRTSIALAELGLRVLGIDVSEPMVEVAREQARHAGVEGRAEFAVMDARRLQLPDAAFGAALYSYNGIELVPGTAGKRQVFAEVARVLVPGGVFLLCAHSLFAANMHAPMRLRAFGRFLLGRVGIPVRERELGERFLDDDWEEAKYLQVLPPSWYRRALRQAGFGLRDFNIRRRIEAGRPWRPWACFADGERFFVAERAADPGRAADVQGVPRHASPRQR